MTKIGLAFLDTPGYVFVNFLLIPGSSDQYRFNTGVEL